MPTLHPPAHPAAAPVQEEEFSDFTGASATAPPQVEEDDFSDFTSAATTSLPADNGVSLQPAIAIAPQAAEHKMLNIDHAFADMTSAMPQAPLPAITTSSVSAFPLLSAVVTMGTTNTVWATLSAQLLPPIL
jgi:hypothetical protein